MLLQLNNITKEFPGVKALDNVSIQIEAGEIHALCGENGAGKTTLMHILSGNLRPSAGTIVKDGRSIIVSSPAVAQENGIAIVHQERSLFEDLSIAENIFAGRQPKNRLGLIDYNSLHIQTRSLLEKLHLDFLSPTTLIKNVSVAHQQMVEVAKALSKDLSILILDEPTASITNKEVDVLFRIIRELRSQGVAILYISHRMEEIFAVADRVSVLKDGKYISTRIVKNTSSRELIHDMVGREIQSLEKRTHSSPDVLLEVINLSGRHFQDINFSLRKGEIAGLAGLAGAGRTEIARAIFGADRYSHGRIMLNGKPYRAKGTANAIRSGISYVPEERKTQGVFMEMSLGENILSADLTQATNNGLFSKTRMSAIAEELKQKFRIVSGTTRQPVKILSGGNQQKVVLAKWLLLNSPVLIVDEPTHGVDIGAKFEIYQLLQQQAALGKAILLISSELPELLMLSDTIYVLYKGAITKKFARDEASEENILHYMAGMEGQAGRIA